GVSLISATCSSATLPILLAIIIASLFDFAFELMPTLDANPRLYATCAVVLVLHFHLRPFRMTARTRRVLFLGGDSKSAHLHTDPRDGERPSLDLAGEMIQVQHGLPVQLVLGHAPPPNRTGYQSRNSIITRCRLVSGS